MKSPRVCAIVLNYGRARDTVECVRSLQDAGYPNLEIVVVDNASPDDSAAIIRQELPSIPILAERVNTGYAGGNNVGIRWALSRGVDHILVTNNDVVFEKGFLDPMAEILEVHKDVGVVTCKVFYQSSRDQIFSGAGSFSKLLCTGLNHGGVLKPSPRTEEECEINYVCGVLLLVRREVFERLGLLDDRYFMYFEDVEFSRRVLTKYRMMYTPRGIAYHKSGGGKGWASYTELYLYYHTRNRLWVFADEPVYYRAYVVAFTLANALAKASTILRNYSRDPHMNKKRLTAIRRGFIDGLFGSPAQSQRMKLDEMQ
jgi:GT2 family glycosyltransferase